jgi:transcriptional regulator with XRE-family HTH domain
MPLNSKALVRRRYLLGMTQNDLAITAGVAPSTLHRIETEKVPEEGGRTGIDVVMRLAAALKMNPLDLMIMPTGNRFERAVMFAKEHHSAESTPKLNDPRRTVKADAYRAITGASAAKDLFPPIREESEGADDEPDRGSDTEGVGWGPASTFLPDPSSE